MQSLVGPGSNELSENLAAAQTAASAAGRPLAGARIAWLHNRWESLNDECPPVRLPAPYIAARDIYGPAPGRRHVRKLIDPRLIVDPGAGIERWGKINNRPHVFELILERLQFALNNDELELWHQRFTEGHGIVHLEATPGPFGPIYRVTRDGRHRAMMARALRLPHLEADVSSDLHPDPGPDTKIYYSLSDPGTRSETVKYYKAMLRAKELAKLEFWMHAPGTPYYAMDIFPAFHPEYAWHFNLPTKAALVSRIYAHCYPEFAHSHPEAMASAEQWRHRVLPGESRIRSRLDRILGKIRLIQ